MMPPIGRLLGGVDFKDLFVSLSAQSFPTLAAAKAAGAPTLNYGVFLNAVINFAIVAFAVFLLVQQVNRLFPKPAGPAAPAMKECAWCASSIPAAAKRCPHCTSNLSGA
jgi:large conductance mechanosensitive channel